MSIIAMITYSCKRHSIFLNTFCYRHVVLISCTCFLFITTYITRYVMDKIKSCFSLSSDTSHLQGFAYTIPSICCRILSYTVNQRVFSHIGRPNASPRLMVISSVCLFSFQIHFVIDMLSFAKVDTCHQLHVLYTPVI